MSKRFLSDALGSYDLGRVAAVTKRTPSPEHPNGAAMLHIHGQSVPTVLPFDDVVSAWVDLHSDGTLEHTPASTGSMPAPDDASAPPASPESPPPGGG